eukprot:jgi/Mesen1/740/ME000110S_11004
MQGTPLQMAASVEDLRLYLQRTTSVGAVCQKIEQFLHRNSGLEREFFKVCFPLLLRKVFGFEDSLISSTGILTSVATSAGGWLASVSRPGSEADAKALGALLSPTGRLFQLLLEVDQEKVVRYVFPAERLPGFVRRLLQSEQGALLLCQASPAYETRIIQEPSGALQVRLDLYEYFIFWFAYYAVCKDVTSRSVRPASFSGTGAGGGAQQPRSQIRAQFENWKSHLPGLHGQSASARGGSLYRDLLSRYLEFFMPAAAAPTPATAAGGSGWPLSAAAAAAASGQVAAASHGDALLQALIEFWLVDDDPYPFSLPPNREMQPLLHGAAAAGVVAMPGLAYLYIPPTEELSICITAVVNHVLRLSYGTLLDPPSAASYSSPLAYGTTTPGARGTASLTPQLAALQRPLYRFLARAFANWPLDASLVARISLVVDIWLSYLEPWKAAAAGNTRQQGGASGRQQGASSSLMRTWSLSLKPLGSPPRQLESPTSAPAPATSGAAAPAGAGAGAAAPGGCVYDERWRTHVLCNYPFYDTLLAHFCEFEIRAAQLDAEAALRELHKVLGVLEGSPALVEVLRRAWLASSCEQQQQQHGRASEWAPLIQHQLKVLLARLEACMEAQQGGAASPPPPSPAPSPQATLLHSAKRRAHHLFGPAPPGSHGLATSSPADHASPSLRRPSGATPSAAGAAGAAAAAGGSSPPGGGDRGLEAKALGKHTWASVKYKGDYMRRPIEAHEIGPLVRFFVWLSDVINEGIDAAVDADDTTVRGARGTGATESSGRHEEQEKRAARMSDSGGTGQPAVAVAAAGSEPGGRRRAAGQQQPQHVRPSSPHGHDMRVTRDSVVRCSKQAGRRVAQCGSKVGATVTSSTRAGLAALGREAKRRGWRVNLRFMAEIQFFVLLTAFSFLFILVRCILSS